MSCTLDPMRGSSQRSKAFISTSECRLGGDVTSHELPSPYIKKEFSGVCAYVSQKKEIRRATGGTRTLSLKGSHLPPCFRKSIPFEFSGTTASKYANEIRSEPES